MRVDSQSSIMPPKSRASTPVERQRKVVPSRTGSSTGPKGIGPILASPPRNQSHQPAIVAAVIQNPHSSPVQKKTCGR